MAWHGPFCPSAEPSVPRSPAARIAHLLVLANRFLEEVHQEVERAADDGSDLPPRLRMVHERAGHASPEFRTLNIPVPERAGGASPVGMSALIARYARGRGPDALLLALELVGEMAGGEAKPLLVVEAHSEDGVRLFWMQPFETKGSAVAWDEPAEGGWQDPGMEEMILDASFPALTGRG